MVKIFYGKDTFSIHREVAELTGKSGAEVSFLTETTPKELSNLLLTQSFFNPKRIIVLSGCLKPLVGSEEEVLLAFENMVDTQAIFIETELPAKSKIVSFAKEKGTIKEFIEPKNVDLVAFIKKTVADHGGEIAPLAVERLAGFVGPDLWQLTEEIKKLVLYKKGNEDSQIQTNDVELLVRANFEANIFSFLDAIAAKNAKKATELLHSFLEAGENEIYLLTMITRQFRNIAMAKFEEGVSEAELAKRAGIHPFVAKKSKEQAKNFGREEILEIYSRLRWADLKLKSGYSGEQVLLRLIAG